MCMKWHTWMEPTSLLLVVSFLPSNSLILFPPSKAENKKHSGSWNILLVGA